MSEENYRIDQDVAEFIFGWKEWITPPDANKQNGGTPVLTPTGRPYSDAGFTYPTLGIIGRGYHTHKWSSDRDSVLEVINHVQRQPYFQYVLDFLFLDLAPIHLAPSLESKTEYCYNLVYEFLKATPKQICLAALEAIKLHRKLEQEPITR